MINDDTLHESGSLSVDLTNLESTFSNLAEDTYAEKGLRSRRYSRYRLDADGKLIHMPHADFMQSSEINKAVGDVERRFEEIESKLEQDAAFVKLFQTFRSHTGFGPDSVIGAHQIRWNCNTKVMIPAPEGTHQDGFDYIAMFMIDPKNLTGGEVLVYQTIGEAPIVKRNLKPGEYVVLNDKKLFHDAAPLVPEPNPEPGHWDMIVLTANKS